MCFFVFCSSIYPGFQLGSSNLFLASSGSTQSESCACPSILYLLLEQLRIKTHWIVPDDVILLRDTTEKAMGVLGCNQCPLRYFSVIQNGLILGVVATCVAECYARLLEQIDQEERRATSQGEKKQYTISNTPSTLSESRRVIGNSFSFSIEVSPSEWREAMRNIVKGEIRGIQGHQSFMSFVSQLEERQKNWHRTPPALDCPPNYRSNCNAPDRIPSCLVVIDDAKRLVNSFNF